MYLDRYRTEANEDLLDFTFTSEGPNGKIKKVIRFIRMFGQIYNVAFGDLDELTGQISDNVVSNNNDSIKILSTVAASIHDFFERYPNVFLFIKGSTHSRTRLYRRAISLYWEPISRDFTVYGQTKEGWQLFIFDEDYTAFLVGTK